MKRFKLSKKRSRRTFRKSASRTHKFNTKTPIMRGGIRL